MEFSTSNPPLHSVLAIDLTERWNVYRRLQQLAVPCHCGRGQPLQVAVTTAAMAVQIWSVLQPAIAPQGVLVERLERCWRAGQGGPSPQERGGG